ncbi:sulfotransferase [Vibrio sp. YMD68]|uniref:sulfotransferase n=1 Tax=Vibrio sp. YMD68 TaxID=3042300 RepID=UPI00249B7792|nr:sulfotransferase [Vibrio sp. YMD68]WGV98436.1 sulfotransferase [Vibrio sp. YMD68]
MQLTSRELMCKTSYVLDHLIARTNDTTPILISGFWRSGTTWVQEVLAQSIGAKTLFEPLDPSSFLPLHDGCPVESSAHIPLFQDVFNTEDLRLLDLSFSGISPKRSGFNYLCRRSLSESLRKKVVIKLVRGQFLIPFLADRYALSTVLHISRHPMAVAYSMLRTNWKWHIKDVDFGQIYAKESQLELPHTQREIFGTLLSFRNETPERKIAALWALSERFAYEQEHVKGFKYESLLQNPISGFTEIANTINQPIIADIKSDKATVVSESDRTNIDMSTRLNSWQTKLTAQQQSDIKAVLMEIWPDVIDQWAL